MFRSDMQPARYDTRLGQSPAMMADRPETGAARSSSTARPTAASSAWGASKHSSTRLLAVPTLCHDPRSIVQMTAPAPPTPLDFRVAPPPSNRMYTHTTPG
eukprot:5097057-Prorocentrum_lima.AAC.1